MEDNESYNQTIKSQRLLYQYLKSLYSLPGFSLSQEFDRQVGGLLEVTPFNSNKANKIEELFVDFLTKENLDIFFEGPEEAHLPDMENVGIVKLKQGGQETLLWMDVSKPDLSKALEELIRICKNS